MSGQQQQETLPSCESCTSPIIQFLKSLFSGTSSAATRTMASSSRVSEAIEKNAVVLCGEDYCPYVRKSKASLEKAGVQFHYLSGMSGEDRAEIAKRSNKSTVPQGFVYGIPIGGCNDGAERWMGIVPLLTSGKLEKAIQAGDAEKAIGVLKS